MKYVFQCMIMAGPWVEWMAFFHLHVCTKCYRGPFYVPLSWHDPGTTNPMCTLISASSALLSINSGLCHPNLYRYEVVRGFPAQLSPRLNCHSGIFCWSCHRNQQRNSRELDTDCHYWDIPVFIPCGPGRFTYTCLIP